MCSGNIRLHGGFHVSNITQIFQFFIFFYHSRSNFNLGIHYEFFSLKVLILSWYFQKFLIFYLSKIYINYGDRSIYFLFGSFTSCFLLLVSGPTFKSGLKPVGPWKGTPTRCLRRKKLPNFY